MFTTHTPVPAGHDAFPFHLVETHLAGCWGRLGSDRDRFLALGELRQRQRPAVQHDRAGAAHGRRRQRRQPAARRRDARDVGADLAGRPTSRRCPVGSITNGVHVPTWIARDAQLFDGTSAPTGSSATTTRGMWNAIAGHPGRGAVGRRARRCACYLFAFIRERARQRWTEERVGAGARRRRRHAARTRRADDRLRPAFRGLQAPELIFHDPERLAAHPERRRGGPVQIVFAGKAHPADDSGQAPPAADLQARARPGVRRPHGLRRRLRSARRALPGAGVRRVAQHAAQAARGQRHERDEGRRQRRAAT